MEDKNLLEKKWDLLTKPFLIVFGIILISILINKYYQIELDNIKNSIYSNKSQEINDKFEMLFKTNSIDISKLEYQIKPKVQLNKTLLNYQENNYNLFHINFKFNNINSLVLIHQEYLEKIFDNTNYKKSEDTSKHLLQIIENNGIEQFINNDNYILIDDYLITKYLIKNEDNVIGYAFSFFEENSIEKNLLHQYKTTVLISIIITLILMLIFITITVLKKYIKNLHNDIEEKDNNLVVQNNKLTDLINSYDKNVIFSKTDMHGKITDVSNAFCEISGYMKEELIGSNHNIVRHPHMPKRVFKNIWERLKSEKIWKGDIKNIRKDGTYYWTRAIIQADFDEYNNLLGYYAIRHDITALKDLDEQQKHLIQSEKLASMGEMIGNIAHQWRQPLSVISTASSGMEVQKNYNLLTDELFYKSCRMITENAEYLSNTIDDFRNYIKGESIKEKFYLDKTISSFINLVKPSITDNSVNIQIESNKEIMLFGFENELIQCLINIFNNAVDALSEINSKEKHIHIETVTTPTNIQVKIQDNAGGIDDMIIDKIFEPYFTTKNKAIGTGLGLHMSYKLITELMNGTLEVSNRLYIRNNIEYTGAYFVISLPLK